MPPAATLARALALVVALVATAHAERKPSAVVADRPRPMLVPRQGAGVPTTTKVSSRLVYLHRCDELTGCTLRTGGDDSRTDTSSIVDSGTKVLGGFKQGDQVWDELVACVRETFAPFDITITTTDPGSTVPHFENVIGGRISDVTSDPELQNAGGVAPFDCGRELPNAIVYTFDVYGPNALELCWTSSQEIAHAFGLDHALLQKDPMTYLRGDLPKRFRDVDAQCGEDTPRSCCGSPSQNSYRRIVGLFGPGAPTQPSVAFRRPAEGKVIQPGYKAVIEALDDVRVEKVELYAAGTLLGTATTSVADTFAVLVPDLGPGEHILEARATDVQGVVNSTSIAVTGGPPCTASAGCTGSDVCAGGVCVPGPDEEGGLGELCTLDTECLSNRCADGGQGAKYCVESCQLGNAASCPSEFACIAAGADGVCWPSPSGGCCHAGTGGGGPGALLLGLGVVLVLRRRRTP